MRNNKSSLDMLAKFLAFYDYSYWHYKLEALYMAIEDENFVKEIADISLHLCLPEKYLSETAHTSSTAS